MNGPEHLAAADTAFAAADEHAPGSPEHAALTATAQAHSTAALAIATAQSQGRAEEDRKMWESYFWPAGR